MNDIDRGGSAPQESRQQRIQRILLDTMSRRAAGDRVADEELLSEYPELLPELADQLKLASMITRAGQTGPPESEKDVAVSDGGTVHHAQTTNRSPAIHVRCPHCRNPIEVVSDLLLSDFICTSCGSSVSLLSSSDSPPVESVGHFRLQSLLGRGSFGSVWKALDTELHRHVAVKLPRQGQLDLDQQEQFLREARAAAALKHPNIVAVHEVGRQDDFLFIVSDFIEGVSLADRFTSGRLEPKAIARLCETIARALHHAHEAGIIHRDLKPSNVMIGADNEPHIMDFGLAKRETGEITMTADGKILGTPAYMSPEQARGDAHLADRRSDVYSLGVILFEALTGRTPFDGNARILIHQVLHDEAPDPRSVNGSLPKSLATICLKCLAKNPAHRYASAELLADDLRRFLRREPISALPVSRASLLFRWVWKHRTRAALLAMSLFIVVLTLASVFQWPAKGQGEIHLTTTGRPVTAEIWDEHEDVLFKRIGVPMADPEPIDEGNYVVKFTPFGQSVSRYDITIHRNLRQSLTCQPYSPSWPTLPVASPNHFAVVPSAGGDDILTFSPTGIKRIDGETRETVWTVDLSESSTASDFDTTGWHHWNSSLSDAKTRMVPDPVRDLNQDGLVDMVLVHPDRPALLALSGRDGVVIWSWSSDVTSKRPTTSISRSLAERPHRIGQPARVDLDSDSVVDYVVSHGQGRVRAIRQSQAVQSTGQPTAWIDAISGTTGRLMWRVDVAPDLLRGNDNLSVSGNNFLEYTSASQFLYAAIPMNIDGQPCILLCTRGIAKQGSSLLTFDGRTGRELHRASLSVALSQIPIAIDDDGDQTDDLVCVSRGKILVRQAHSDVQRWSRDMFVRTASLLSAASETGETQKRIACLSRAGSVHVLDLVSGRDVWHSKESRPGRVSLAGQDLDHNDYDDVLRATLTGDDEGPQTVTLTALSGKDGTTIWSNSHKIPSELRLRAGDWQMRTESLSERNGIVPARICVSYAPSDRGTGHQLRTVFNARSGRIANQYMTGAECRLTDFDGDGMEDFCWFQLARGKTGEIFSLKGLSPVVWRRTDVGESFSDADGDGVNEMLITARRDLLAVGRDKGDGSKNRGYAAGWDRLQAEVTLVSGANGKNLWTRIHPRVDVRNVVVQHDWDGDGIHDVLVSAVSPKNGSVATCFSGTDSRRLWSYRLTDHGQLSLVPSHSAVTDWAIAITNSSTDNVSLLLSRPPKGTASWPLGRDVKKIVGKKYYDGISLLGTLPSTDMTDSSQQFLAVAMVYTDIVTGVFKTEVAAIGTDNFQLSWQSPLSLDTRDRFGRGRLSGAVASRSIDDMDGDGMQELMVANANAVTVLGGKSGKLLWQWTSPRNSEIDAVYELKFKDRRHRVVAVTRAGCSLLDRRGVAEHVRLLPINSITRDHPILWRDIDSDGVAEAILIRQSTTVPTTARNGPPMLCAYRSNLRELVWERPLPVPRCYLDTETSYSVEHGDIVLVSNNVVYGFDPSTGTAVWTCVDQPTDKPRALRDHRLFGPRVLGEIADGLPLVVFRHGNQSCCRAAQPVPVDRGVH